MKLVCEQENMCFKTLKLIFFIKCRKLNIFQTKEIKSLWVEVLKSEHLRKCEKNCNKKLGTIFKTQSKKVFMWFFMYEILHVVVGGMLFTKQISCLKKKIEIVKIILLSCCTIFSFYFIF